MEKSLTHTGSETRLGVSRRRWIAVLVVCVALVAALWLGRTQVLRRVGQWLDVSSTSFAHADVAYILGGGRSTRPDFASRLFHDGMIQKAVVPGSEGLADVEGVVLLSEQEIVDGMLRALGVPEKSIERLATPCESTEDEARELAAYLERNPELTIAVITNDYHTRRCRQIFRRVLGPRFAQVTILGCASGHGGADGWWRTSEGLTAYVIELLKLTRETWKR